MPVVTVHPSGEVIYLDPDETVLSGLYKAGYAYAILLRTPSLGSDASLLGSAIGTAEGRRHDLNADQRMRPTAQKDSASNLGRFIRQLERAAPPQGHVPHDLDAAPLVTSADPSVIALTVAGASPGRTRLATPQRSHRGL